MRRLIFLASVSVTALMGTAFAADLIPPPPPVPIFTWTGVYLGGQIGYGWGSGNLNYSGFDQVTGTALATSVGGTPSGVVGGAHVGYQYQINQWVLGLEGSVDGTGLTNTAVAAFAEGTGVTASTTATVQGSIRGKLGIAWDRALIYATGGVAFGGFDTSFSVANPGTLTRVPFFAGDGVSTTRVGWTVGGGVQYAVTDNWWVFAEYRYSNFGTVASTGLLAGSPRPFAGAFLNANCTLNQNQAQVGFSYRFDMFNPPPVVAKY